MSESLVTVVSLVAVLAGVIAIFTLITSRETWSELAGGRSDAAQDDDHGSPMAPLIEERDEEIRQMLGARNDRRTRNGTRPLDLDEELALLLRPRAEDALRDDLRAVVEARNRRRERDGMQPLDVETEIERRLRGLN